MSGLPDGPTACWEKLEKHPITRQLSYCMNNIQQVHQASGPAFLAGTLMNHCYITMDQVKQLAACCFDHSEEGGKKKPSNLFCKACCRPFWAAFLVKTFLKTSPVFESLYTDRKFSPFDLIFTELFKRKLKVFTDMNLTHLAIFSSSRNVPFQGAL